MFETNLGDASKLMSWIRAGGEEHLRRVDLVRNAFTAAMEKMDEKDLQAEIDRLIARVKASFLDGTRSTIAESFLETGEALPRFESDAQLQSSAPTLYCLMDITVRVLRNASMKIAHPNKPKRSDVGDIYHAAYLPRVDVFRCDSAMRENLEPLARKFGAALEPSLDGLLKRLSSVAPAV
jgi:hypothetical protein